MIETFPADRVEELQHLQRQLWSHHVDLPLPPGFEIQPDHESWRMWLKRVRAALSSGNGVVLVDDVAAPRGFAFVTMLAAAEVERPVLTGVGPHGELVALVVDASARSDGLGALLLTAAQDWCRTRGAVAMHIGVRASNVDAHRFYVRHGAVDAYTTMITPLTGST